MMQTIVDHLWQSTLFAVVAWLLTLVLRNNAARIRYWVWLAASIKFLIPFSLLTTIGNQFSWRTTPTSQLPESFTAVVQQIANLPSTPPIALSASQPANFDFMPIFLGLWVLGAAALLTRWLVMWARIKRATRTAVHAAIEAPISVKYSPALSEPGVVGIFQPVLLLPEGIATRLTQAQLQAVLAHELSHVRRRDNLTAAIHMLVEACFWFHPLVWWIGAHLVEERERACDEAVVEVGNEPQAYAEGILKVCQFYMESKLTCVAGVSGANLKKRVEVIMSNRIASHLSFVKKALLASAATIAVATPIAVGLIAARQVNAQANTATPRAFDEVSIKLAAPPETGNHSQYIVQGRGNFATRNLPLGLLVAFAYDTSWTQIVGGPSWLKSAHYDIDATTLTTVDGERPEGESTYARLSQALLADRFALRAHKEMRILPVFLMSVARHDDRLAKFEMPSNLPAWAHKGRDSLLYDGAITASPASMSRLARQLSDSLGRPVVDRTGLDGRYSFRVETTMTADAVSAALEQQLGLKLEQQAVPVEVLVIEDIRQPVVASSSDSGIAPNRTNSVPSGASATPTEIVLNNPPPSDEYKGASLSLNFKDIDIRALLGIFSNVSGQRIEIDPKIRGERITARFTNVPWDQALDVILKAKGLTTRRDGDVLYIGPVG